MKDEPIGIIIGTTNPYSLNFEVLRDEKKAVKRIYRGQFVKIPFKSVDGSIEFEIGRIVSVSRSNQLITEDIAPQIATMMGEGNIELSDFGFRRDLSESVIAEVEILGHRIGNELVRPRAPLIPGELIFKADTVFLKEQLRPQGEDFIKIGVLRDDLDVPVFINYEQLVSKHFAILAMTGGGKSYTCSVILEEIVNEVGLPIVVFDPHGEYYGFLKANDRLEIQKSLKRLKTDELDPSLILEIGEKVSKTVKVFSPDKEKLNKIKKKIMEKLELSQWVDVIDLKIQLGDLETYQIISLLEVMSDLSAAQRRLLEAAWGPIHDQAMKGEFVSFDSIKSVIEDNSDMVRGRSPVNLLIKKLEIFYKYRPFFAKSPAEKRISISDLIKVDQVSVIDLSMIGLHDQQALGAILSTQILKGRIDGEIPPTLVILEEAHRFAPSGHGINASLPTIRRIAQEGRKFFVGLGLISQRPSRIDSDVLSQCNTQIILRLTNPSDQNYVQKISEWVSIEDINEIRTLPPGEAFIFGPAVFLSLPAKIRPKATFHGGVTPNLKEELELFRK